MSVESPDDIPGVFAWHHADLSETIDVDGSIFPKLEQWRTANVPVVNPAIIRAYNGQNGDINYPYILPYLGKTLIRINTNARLAHDRSLFSDDDVIEGEITKAVMMWGSNSNLDIDLLIPSIAQFIGRYLIGSIVPVTSTVPGTYVTFSPADSITLTNNGELASEDGWIFVNDDDPTPTNPWSFNDGPNLYSTFNGRFNITRINQSGNTGAPGHFYQLVSGDSPTDKYRIIVRGLLVLFLPIGSYTGSIHCDVKIGTLPNLGNIFSTRVTTTGVSSLTFTVDQAFETSNENFFFTLRFTGAVPGIVLSTISLTIYHAFVVIDEQPKCKFVMVSQRPLSIEYNEVPNLEVDMGLPQILAFRFLGNNSYAEVVPLLGPDAGVRRTSDLFDMDDSQPQRSSYGTLLTSSVDLQITGVEAAVGTAVEAVDLTALEYNDLIEWMISIHGLALNDPQVDRLGNDNATLSVDCISHPGAGVVYAAVRTSGEYTLLDAAAIKSGLGALWHGDKPSDYGRITFEAANFIDETIHYYAFVEERPDFPGFSSIQSGAM